VTLDDLTFALDFSLIITSAVIAVVASRMLGGHSSKGIALSCAGLIALGFVHLSETSLDVYAHFSGGGMPEIVHRLLVFGGFALLGVGLARIGSELRKEMSALRNANTALASAHADLTNSNNELRERNKQLVDARVTAATDGLTGLFNHRAFHVDIRTACAETHETNETVSLIMLDLDGFKSINDTFGHLAGDEILERVAVALKVVCQNQQAYRYGGDEFAVIIPNTSELEAKAIAERLRVAVVSSVSMDAQSVVTASMGVASYPDGADTPEQLIYRADAAMYWAKSVGKNHVACWSDLSGDGERLAAAAKRSQLIRVA
jgi:diguanylate cyclase (GGDEF)-like protein